MSENQNRGSRDYSKFDAMTVEELEQFLRLDAEAPEGQESDVEELLYVMEVLSGRRNKNNAGKTAQQAWESFQQNYLPTEEDCLEHTLEVSRSRKATSPWLRRLTAAAAALALVICLSATASAFGWENIWNAVAKWANETFSFVGSSQIEVSEPDSRSIQEYTSIQHALMATGHPYDFVPTWIPEGYELKDITVDENPIQSVYIAIYKNGEKTLKITVQSYLNTTPEINEKSDTAVEVYEVNGAEYYIFFNVDQICAGWVWDSYECYISSELTVEELKTMIDSVEKG